MHFIQEPSIVFEDKQMMIIDKPAGLVVNRAESVQVQTVQDWIEEKKYWLEKKGSERLKKSTPFFARSGIVHRLDRETSGVMIVAKTPEAFEQLTILFVQRKVHKVYLALVHGHLEPKRGTIALPIARSAAQREQFHIEGKGRYAETEWEVISYFSQVEVEGLETKYQQGFTSLHLYPKTGRTHQIRVHMAHLSHPIVGDSRYTGKKRTKTDRIWCPRQFLHAEKISFFHPETQKECTFRASLPEDLERALALLK